MDSNPENTDREKVEHLSTAGIVLVSKPEGDPNMKKYLFAAAIVSAIVAPAFADDVGVRVGPVGAGVTTGETHDRDHERDRTVIKEHEPESKTVIKKEDDMGNREKTIIHHDN
jgi:hypothetical protein